MMVDISSCPGSQLCSRKPTMKRLTSVCLVPNKKFPGRAIRFSLSEVSFCLEFTKMVI